MPRFLILWLSVIWSSAYCADQTYAFGYNTADARIFKGNDNQAYYYLAGSVYDMKNDQWEHYPGGLAVYKNNSLNLVIKDHLTNIRAVVSSDNSTCSSTTYEAQYDYYPYGKVLRKIENPRSRFQSTDHETDLETGYNNRNARWYDDESFQFLGCDPMQSTYPSWSPYHYVARNPIRLIDPSGKSSSPIYNTDGEFLGTDDEGLQGKPILLEDKDFEQGMSHNEAIKKDLAPNGGNEYIQKIKNLSSYWSFYDHYSSLSSRPDYDGFVTIEEGIKWAKANPNALQNPTPNNTLYINTAKLDFGNLNMKDAGMKKSGVSYPVNLNNFGNFSSSITFNSRLGATVYALGRVDIFLHNMSGKISIVNNNATDYDWNSGGGVVRSSLIGGERIRAGLNDSHGFRTFYYGYNYIPKF